MTEAPVRTVPVAALREGDAILWEDNIAEILEIDRKADSLLLTVKAHYGRRELVVLRSENVQLLVTADGF